MTTIAIKDGVMACDGRVCAGDTIVYGSMNKIFRHDGKLYGMCGSCQHIEIFKKCVASGRDFPEELEMVALLMTSKGNYRVSITCGVLVKDPSVGSFAAIGSGGDFAWAAMKAGASAKEAVKIACELDVYSGGRVREVSL